MQSWITELSFHVSVLCLLSILYRTVSFVHLLLFHSYSHHLDVIFLQAASKLLQLSNSWILLLLLLLLPLLLLEPTRELKTLEVKAWMQVLYDCMEFPIVSMAKTQCPSYTIGSPESECYWWTQRGWWTLLALLEWQTLIKTGSYVPATTCVILSNMATKDFAKCPAFSQ